MAEASATLDTLFPHGQIKLRALSVYNWGSFCGLHTALIDPYGTLITGDNGAGKSTLVDGLIALLLSSGKATFNVAAAQGDKADRSVISYIRGSFGSEHDGTRTRVQSKRSGAVVAGLSAGYVGDDGAQFTLATLMWIATASNSLADLKRLHFVARRELTLQEILESFDKGQSRAVKQRYRSDDTVQPFEHFTEYQECYRNVLYMHNENAPSLLARALGLKKIDDLTALIRDFVLEPSKVREAARHAVAEFGDLVATHNELADARQQQQQLMPLPAIQQEMTAADTERKAFEADLRGLPVYLAMQAQQLWDARIQAIRAELDVVNTAITQLKRAEEDGKKNLEDRHADYLQAGGNRLEDLRREQLKAKDCLDLVTVTASKYQDVTRKLQLQDKLIEPMFLANQERGRKAQSDFESRKKDAQDRFGAISVQYSISQERLKEVQTELANVEKRPDSSINPHYQDRRDELAEVLGVERQELLFIGELLEVKSGERPWQGAIERALGGLRTTLVVPENLYPLVTRWANGRHLGIVFRAQVAKEVKTSSRFKDDGFLRKLEWREHRYRDWLKNFLARFDLSCVASTEILDNTPFSITQAGLIHRESGRFEKNDQRRIDEDWSLGYRRTRSVAYQP